MKLSGWTKEPLVHFLAAGALVFAGFLFFPGDAETDPNSRVIDVDEETLALLSSRFEANFNRLPTDAELDASIDQYVRDEVLYREALRLGLDQNDEVVRRRLIAKMDLAAGSPVDAARPDDATLRGWFEENRGRYTSDTRLSFDQLFFETESQAAAARGLALPIGQRISLPESADNVSQHDLASIFGEQFAQSLAEMELGGDWKGPVQSGFGWHLARVRERSEGEVPEFENLRDRVEADWRSETAASRREDAYQVLREAYRVNITQ